MNDTLCKMRDFRGNEGTVWVTVCHKQDPQFIAEGSVCELTKMETDEKYLNYV